MAEYQTIIVATGCVLSIATVVTIRVDIDWLKSVLDGLKFRVVELDKAAKDSH
ncbi:hypothetical protein AB6C40_18850 [Vibrio splendidus]|jgi:hypothetical protein